MNLGKIVTGVLIILTVILILVGTFLIDREAQVLESSGSITLVNGEVVDCAKIGPNNHISLLSVSPVYDDHMFCQKENEYLIYKWADIMEIKLNRLPEKRHIRYY